jgi:signal transduction histidine kinase
MEVSSKDAIKDNDESIDLLIQVWIRFIIAFYSLLVFFLDHDEAGHVAPFIDKLLISYCLYSVCLLFVYDMQKIRKLVSIYSTHWIDTLFFIILIAFTAGSRSLYFPFLFFPIMVASFSWGFVEGIKVVVVTVVLYGIAILGLFLAHAPFELDETLMRPIYLIVFGSMIAYWGGARATLNRRLHLLKVISTNWNPRFGIDHAIRINLERLTRFFGASRCVLVLERQEGFPKYVMHAVDTKKPDTPESPKAIEPETAKELLRLPRTVALSYENPSESGFGSFNKSVSYDVNTLESTDRYTRESKTLSSLFDDQSFVSVPYKQQGVASGRLYLIAADREFSRSDVFFTKQVADVISSVIDNMELIENLIAEASGKERLRISLDVHDTTIQPYIGLTLALDALAIEFNSDKQLVDRINEIIKMANMTILDLRSYKDTLREKSLMRGDVLLSSIHNQGERLHRFYGIQVDVSGSVDPNLSGNLAEATFQIVKEGLSNVLRHTNAKQVTISLSNTEEYLFLEIGNETDPDVPVPQFIPKSILERVQILNGEMLVENNSDRYTVIRIKIPFETE